MKNKLAQVIGNEIVEFSGVYGIGPHDREYPLKIGYAKRPDKRLCDIQASHWDELVLRCVGWVPDFRLARRVEVECHRMLDLAGKRIRGDWFEVNAEWAWKTMKVAASNLKIPLLTTKQVQPLLRTRGEIEMLSATGFIDFTFDRVN